MHLLGLAPLEALVKPWQGINALANISVAFVLGAILGAVHGLASHKKTRSFP